MAVQWKNAETEEVLDIEFALVDGYGFGDRFLENVMFKVTAKLESDEIKYTCEVTDEAREYLSKSCISIPMWEEKATEFANYMPDSFCHPENPSCDVYAEVV